MKTKNVKPGQTVGFCTHREDLHYAPKAATAVYVPVKVVEVLPRKFRVKWGGWYSDGIREIPAHACAEWTPELKQRLADHRAERKREEARELVMDAIVDKLRAAGVQAESKWSDLKITSADAERLAEILAPLALERPAPARCTKCDEPIAVKVGTMERETGSAGGHDGLCPECVEFYGWNDEITAAN